MLWFVKINIELKEGVLDAQGKATYKALLSLGFNNVKEVRVGKIIEFQIDSESREDVEIEIEEMCQKLLANPVIEKYEYEIEAYK